MAEPIDNKFLDRGDLFGLEFRDGFIFYQVRAFEETHYQPHTQFGDIDADSSYSNYQRLDDADGDDILFVPKEDVFKIKHAAIGHKPSFIRRFTNYPEDEVRLRSTPNLGPPTTGDKFGYIDGYDSPYEQPTDAEELFIPSNNHLNFNFYNPDEDQHAPTIQVMMRTYKVDPLNPNNKEDKNAIKAIVNPKTPMPLPPAGSLDTQVPFTYMSTYDVRPMTLKEARNL